MIFSAPQHRRRSGRVPAPYIGLAVAGMVGAVVVPTALASTTTTTSANLVRNPGFESSTSYWRTNSSAEVLAAVASPHTGSYAARLTTTKTVTAVLNDNPNTVSSTTKGATYTAGAWVRTTTPSVSGELRVREVASGTQVAKVAAKFSLSDTSWHFLSLTYVAAGAGNSLDLNVAANSLSTTKNLLIDDVSLTATTTVTSSPSPSPTATATSSPTATATSSPSPTSTSTPLATATATSSPSPTATATSTTSTCTVNAILVPSCGAWTGVAPNILNGETYDQSLVNFEAQTGHTTDISHYYHRGTQLFPTSTEIYRATEPGKNRLLLENWKPENGNTWAGVAAGASDSLIDQEAAYIKGHFTRRFFLAIHGEPERSVNATAGSGYEAKDYAAMYRHVILRLRADGVANIVSVLDLTGLPNWGTQSWFPQIYPGNDVVDWLAEDPYEVGPTGGWYDNDFVGMVDRTFPGYNWPGFYTWAGQVAPGKPIMIAEWGADELSGYPTWKPSKFQSVASELAKMPNVKALVYWNSNNFNPVGTTRVDSSSASLAAYQQLLSIPALNQTVPTS